MQNLLTLKSNSSKHLYVAFIVDTLHCLCKCYKFLFVKVTKKLRDTLGEFQIGKVLLLGFVSHAWQEIQGHFCMKRNCFALNFLARFLIKRVLFSEFEGIIFNFFNVLISKILSISFLNFFWLKYLFIFNFLSKCIWMKISPSIRDHLNWIFW